ncbi:MAG: hypothetical protein AB1896_16840 [Thermodesulfobacteriota bacterium]
MSKKYDPEMHTAEHILNQTMVRMFDCGRCFSAHVAKRKSKCDYRFHRDLTGVEAAEIERRVNEVIVHDLPVTEEFMSREEASRAFSLERLPDLAGEDIRIVRVGEYDACPCIGPHAGSTRELGGFRLISHSFEDGVLRIRFKLERGEGK